MKDLNDKFLPELSKLELQIEGFRLEQERMQEIMRRFDSIITNKCSKEKLKEI